MGWSLRQRLLFSFGLATLCIFIVAELLIVFGVPYTPFKGLWARQTQKTIEEISTMADARRGQLERWLFERKGDLLAIAQNPLLEKSLQAFFQQPSSVSKPEAEMFLKQLRIYFQRIQWNYIGEYSRIEIIEAHSGKILISTRPEEEGKDLSRTPYFRKAIAPLAEEIVVEEQDESGKSLNLAFAQAIHQPVEVRPDTINAILVLHSTGSFINSLLHEGIGQTGEVVMVDQDSRLMAPLRYPLADGRKAQTLDDIIPSKPSTLAAQGIETVIETKDYRGVEVLAATRHLQVTSEMAWGLVVKMDIAEVSQPIRRDLVTHALVLAGALIVGWFMIMLIATRLTKPLADLSRAAVAVAEGDLSIRTIPEGSSELQHLSYSFNSMAARLEGWYKDLAGEVAKRTDELSLANLALTKSNEKFLSLVANTPGYIAYVNADTLQYEFVNDAFEKAFGIPKEKIVGSHIREIIGENNYQAALQYIAEVKLGKSISYENTFNLISGRRWIQVNYSPIINADGHVSSIVVLSIDITERKQAEVELRKSEGQLRTLVQTIPDLIWLKDKNGVYLSCNPIFERFFGAKETNIIGKTDYDFVDRELADSFVENDRKAMAAGKPTSSEEWITFADDGHRILLETIKTPMYDNTGILIGVLGIGRDITERKRVEEENAKLEVQLQQAQKMEAIGQLAGGVAHDFNNMLGVIQGHAEMAMELLDPAQPLYADLNEILKAAGRSADITRQLLAFARKQTIAPKVLDLNETVEGMLKMLRRLIGEDIDIVWMPGSGLWQVKVDPSQIDQILANLCINARAAISGVGKITVMTENCTLDECYSATHTDCNPGEYVRITVSDSGCGMDKTTLAHIFEPFFTTKSVGEGTGLGLATVFGAVKQNKGIINVYSEPGQGTSFAIHLPRYFGNTQQSTIALEMEPAAHGHETILLVEDEPTILGMTARMLERLGYTVLAASSPEEAIRLVTEFVGEVYMLMTDVVMPGMNGRDLADRLLKDYPTMKCLFMSGYTANIITTQGVLGEGMNFIQKPFSRKELAAKVRQVLESKEN